MDDNNALISVLFVAHLAVAFALDNWLRELKTWCPALKVLLYYGNQEERREIRNLVFEGEMEEFNVVVTT